jgi:multimeric flavodoxin WrbA
MGIMCIKEEEYFMKVLLINGSPHEMGCTYTALKEVAGALETCGAKTEIFWIGDKPISGCTGCRGCRKTGRCVINDVVNVVSDKAAEADGIIVGSPVHYAGASGAVTSMLDRMFYSSGGRFAYKPAACVLSCRRGGATAAFDQLNKYFAIAGMPIATSQYWNMVHGNTPEEVCRDLEGLQTMRTLGRNMAWLIFCIEAGKAAGLPLPEKEPKVATNFIR